MVGPSKDHACHYCTSVREVKVLETYPCGTRLVYAGMIGVCCKCGGRNTLWGGEHLRENGEPDDSSLDYGP